MYEVFTLTPTKLILIGKFQNLEFDLETVIPGFEEKFFGEQDNCALVAINPEDSEEGLLCLTSQPEDRFCWDYGFTIEEIRESFK
jgi:hypothetical protein